jgi:putative addiction module component (TIGR02574 family)
MAFATRARPADRLRWDVLDWVTVEERLYRRRCAGLPACCGNGARLTRLCRERPPGAPRESAVGARLIVVVMFQPIRGDPMSSKDVLEQALKLKPEERFMVVEGIIKSLDEPDSSLDTIWADEAERRLDAYRAGNLEGIPMEEIFKDEQ